MFTLFKKELASFFSSLIGYLTIIVFLVLTGLMLWVFKSDFNILDYGFASIDGLFIVGPFLYLFLIPAITICLIVLSLNLFGDGLRDAFDPKLNA